MPTVPDYGGRKVEPTPTPGVRQTGPGGAAETPESAGAGIGGAIADAGLTGVKTGLQFGEVSHQLREKEKQRADQIFELTATRRANESSERVLRDPQTGVLNARGLDVMPAADKGFASWDSELADIKKSATNPEQQLIAEQIGNTYSARLTDTIHTHQDQQLRAYDDSEMKGLVASSQAFVVSNATTSPGSVTDTIHDVSDKVTKYAQRNGLGPEATDQMLAETRNQLATAAVAETLTKGNPVLAKAYIDHYSDQGILTGDARVKLEEAVKRGLNDDAGDTMATTIWTKLGPKGDTDPISIDKMEDAARAQTKGDPDLFKATLAALRTRKEGVDAGRRERLDGVQQKLWGAVLSGQAYGDISHMPEAVTHPEELLKVRDYLEGRAAAVESRAYTGEARAETAAARRERQLYDQGFARYYELTDDPRTLRDMTNGQVMSLLPTLGHQLTSQLLERKKTITANDTEFARASIDTDLFKANASSAGFSYVYSDPSKLTGDQKSALGKLHAAVEQAVGVEQLSKQRKLTPEETTAVQQRVIDRTVFLHNWVYKDQEQTAAVVVNSDDQARAYVPIKRIQPQALTEWINLIRTTVPGAQQFTRDQILARYTDRIQRAHAATMMSLGAEEERRRLLGQ